MTKNIVAALDLGTTKVCVVIAEKTGNDQYTVLGYGTAKSEGMTKGMIMNVGRTVDAIREAVEIAETRAGIKIRTVNVGVAGEHISSLRHRNYVTITNAEHEVTEDDLVRLDKDVRLIKLPPEKQILHIIQEEFIVDDQNGIDDPIGMTGIKLEALNYIVLAGNSAVTNLKKVVEKAGLQVSDLILQPIASAQSVLEDNEADLGVLLIDIGGGTTDIAIVHHNTIKYSKVFGIAGNLVTNDIREALGVVTDEAEDLKRKYGYATESAFVHDEDILIKGVGARGSTHIPLSLLTQIVGSRMKELFELIEIDIRSSGHKNKIRAGIILTGGGSMLKGATDLAFTVFSLPARLGVPLQSLTKNFPELEKPEFATVLGLLRGTPGKEGSASVPYEIPEKKETPAQPETAPEKPAPADSKKSSGKGVISNIIDFFKNF
ncbi:MAG: Cell division protein FtsA [Ignavibacteriaceae bacterium]|nr:Cell division protein FtsA [Ignavibacteriaceae bacterium]